MFMSMNGLMWWYCFLLTQFPNYPRMIRVPYFAK
jgi:hypothetical protein